MKRYNWLYFLLFFASSTMASSINTQLVAKLDSTNAMHSLSIMKLHPKEYTKLLIDTLAVIENTDKITSAEATSRKSDIHKVWIVRALAFLTGKQVATSKVIKANIDEERLQFLSKPNGKLKYFGVQMSTETIYIAPVNGQAEIIRLWKSWACNNLKNYEFPENVDLNNWYF